MKNRYDEAEAAEHAADPVALRAYTSRLLGADPELVLHGGGNTSVKVTGVDFFGDPVELLYVKGSGWDLATIEPAGFAPVRLEVLLRLAGRERLSDSDMVREQRLAMLDPDAPNPSVEAILHALIPAPWVDHTHADAVVTLSNTPDGPDAIRALYGDRVVVVPYVMPGFVLARAVRQLLADRDLSTVEGMVLLHHGIFTWGETARESYDRMIALVSAAEDHLRERGAWDVLSRAVPTDQPLALAAFRRAVGRVRGAPVIARFDHRLESAGFAAREDVAAIASRGPVTPDHIIRTKRVPLVLDHGEDPEVAVAAYVDAYGAYFARHDPGTLTRLDPAPRWAVWRRHGVVAFGRTVKEADVVADIARHTTACIQRAEAAGGWRALDEAALFEMEYWELEQAKLTRHKAPARLAGRVALVTGAAHGIGRAAVERLRALGAAVVALDVDEAVVGVFAGDPGVLGVPCDITDSEQVDAAVLGGVRAFGGLDMLVSNAGTFPPALPIDALDDGHWGETLSINLTGHLRVLRAAAPFLALGFDPAVVFVASKNVAAPGAGVAAYSVAKAGMTQLARVAAIELGERGIRVNVVHPDAVFDTALWTEEKIAARAASYGLTSEAYRRRNVLQRDVRAVDVAHVIGLLLSPELRATTGAQIAVDGGNARTI